MALQDQATRRAAVHLVLLDAPEILAPAIQKVDNKLVV
jgi:hypothetical protein